MRKSKLAAIAICMVISLSPALAAAQITKCVDAGGNVTYSDRGCDNGNSSKVKISDNTTDGTQYRKSVIRQKSQAATQAYQAENQQSTPSQDNYEQEARERSLGIDAKSRKYSATQIKAMQEAMKMPDSRNLILDIKRGKYTAAELRAKFNLPNDSPAKVNANMPASAPGVITNCDPSGCWDSNGLRYNKGTGTTYFSASGSSCQLIGGQMQCP